MVCAFTVLPYKVETQQLMLKEKIDTGLKNLIIKGMSDSDDGVRREAVRTQASLLSLSMTHSPILF